MNAGSSREIITPALGNPLAGYFSPRPNVGMLDDLFVRVLLLECDGVVAGVVTLDLCAVDSELVDRIKSGLLEHGMAFGDHLIFNTTHTHSGPMTLVLFGASDEAVYMQSLVNKTVMAVSRAHENLAPAELLSVSVRNNPFAFNRRYHMKDGRVMTNPGKLNPGILRPEGPVDDEISILAVRQSGRISAMAVNLVNHTDTIGGESVSADWPGRMEREIQRGIGYDLPVLTLIGCSGNINHFDVSSAAPQTSYSEACRIGKGYADIVLGAMGSLERMDCDRLEVVSRELEIPFRTLSGEDLARAEETLARLGPENSEEAAMTSEGLADGSKAVLRFFSRQLVAYSRNCSGLSRKFKIVAIHVGSGLSLLSLPGEPFTEIGLAIKAGSPRRAKFILSLAMGYCGYIPLPECFGRGGYETLPVEGGAPREDTAERLIAVGLEIL